MPEGPEVRTVVDELQSLVGKTLTGVEVNSRSRYFGSEMKGMPELPLRVLEIHHKGKQIFFKMEKTNGGLLYLNSHLGMEGKWLWKPGKHSGVEMIFEDQTQLFFDDSRHFGRLEWLNPESYRKKLASLGPDLLQEDLEEEKWFQIIENKRIKRKEVADFLLDQKRVSGIGNYLKSEILYRARIRPNRPLSSLESPEKTRLLQVTRETIRESYRWGGFTIASYISPNGKEGGFIARVYQKKTSPEGYQVIRGQFKDRRTTFWVPEVQK